MASSAHTTAVGVNISWMRQVECWSEQLTGRVLTGLSAVDKLGPVSLLYWP